MNGRLAAHLQRAGYQKGMGPPGDERAGLGGSGTSEGWAGTWSGASRPGALVGLAGFHRQESQHSRVLPELHATLCGEAHVFGQVINSSWKRKRDILRN